MNRPLIHEDYRRIARIMQSAGYFITNVHNRVFLEDYFPEESFVRIDIDHPEESVEKIRSVIEADNWEKRIPAIEEARNFVLYEYQLFPHLVKLMRKHPNNLSKSKEMITIPAYKRSARRVFHRILYKIRKQLRML